MDGIETCHQNSSLVVALSWLMFLSYSLVDLCCQMILEFRLAATELTIDADFTVSFMNVSVS